MTRMIELTDLMDGATTHEPVPVDQVAARIRTWYPADDQHIRPSELEYLEEFQAALLAEDYSAARDIAAELAIQFDVV